MTSKTQLHSTIKIAIQSVMNERNNLEQDILNDKALVALFWDRSDVSRPVSTENDFMALNYYKDLLKKDQKRMTKLVNALHVLKKMERML